MDPEVKLSRQYKPGATITMVATRGQTETIMEEWLSGNWNVMLHVSRSSTKAKCYEIQTVDVVWAARIVKWKLCFDVFYT